MTPLPNDNDSVDVHHDSSSKSISTIGNISYAAHSVLTSDETVVRRGDGAQIMTTKLQDPQMSISKTSITNPAISRPHQKSTDSHSTSSNNGQIGLCCCLHRRRIVV